MRTHSRVSYVSAYICDLTSLRKEEKPEQTVPEEWQRSPSSPEHTLFL